MLEKIARKIVEKLQKAGFEAYFAGGAVRDKLLDKEPKDIDIATSAKPEQIENIFKKTIPVGKQFGVIIVVEGGINFEVATFRKEGEYLDFRRPSAVTFSDAKTDALRRDFTVNGLFYDPLNKKIIDFVGGQRDIRDKIIRFIGSATERINEDNLRILRAIRFKNILKFKYAPGLEKLLKKNINLLKNVSAERIRDEVNLMFSHDSRLECIGDLDNLGVLQLLLTEVVKMKGVKQPEQFHQEGDVFEHSKLAVEHLPKKELESILVWAVLLHDVGKPDTFEIRDRITFYGHMDVGAEIASKIASRLKFSKEDRDKLVFLVKNHLVSRDLSKMKKAKQIRWANYPWFSDLLVVFKADSDASLPHDYSLYNYAKQLYERELSKPKLPKPLISGYDLIDKFKIKPGPKIGEILEIVYDAQLEKKIKNKKEALSWAKKII